MVLLIPFLYKYIKNIHTGWFVLILPFALFLYFLSLLPITSSGQTIMRVVNWMPSLKINFGLYVDGISLLFYLLITGIGTLGIVLSDNLVVLYVFWEITSISSSLLISYWFQREKSIYGAQKSMFITVFGGLSMLGGISLLYVMTGSFSVQEIIGSADLVSTSS